MTDTINNVPRELLERLAEYAPAGFCAPTALQGFALEARRLLSAPSPAGVDGLEVVGWYTEDHLDDKSATTYSREVADRWLAKGWPVNGIANAADAQAIIDGLRGEVAQLQSMLATVSKAGIRVRTDRDQQAQRIGELASHLEFAVTLLTVAGLAGNAQVEAMRAALSAGREPKQCT